MVVNVCVEEVVVELVDDVDVLLDDDVSDGQTPARQVQNASKSSTLRLGENVCQSSKREGTKKKLKGPWLLGICSN